MGKLIGLTLMLLTLTVPVQAQDGPRDDVAPTFASGNDVKALQEQLASLIKARGEDQKVILSLSSQLAAVAARLPAPNAEESKEKSKANLKRGCESFDMRLDRVEIVRGPENSNTITVICK